MKNYDCLIFTGGEAPLGCQYKNLLEGKPYVIAADSGWDIAKRENIEVDSLVGDFDSHKLELPTNKKFFSFSREKDFTDTELAFQLAKKEGKKSCAVVGGGGGRMDHWLSLWSLWRQEQNWLLWETKDETLLKLHEGENWLGGGSPKVVSVFPLTLEAEVLTTGFRWSLTGLKLSQSIYSLSNEVKGEEASLQVVKGSVALIFPRFAEVLTED